MRHIDDFISDLKSDAYAAFIFNQFRLPAILRCRFDKVMRERGLLLFCTYQEKRWRVTGASRMGDVWLSADFKREMGYEHRVDVDACSEWSATPESPSVFPTEPRSEAWKKYDRPCEPCPDCGAELYEKFWGNGGWAKTDKATDRTHGADDCVKALKVSLAERDALLVRVRQFFSCGVFRNEAGEEVGDASSGANIRIVNRAICEAIDSAAKPGPPMSTTSDVTKPK